MSVDRLCLIVCSININLEFFGDLLTGLSLTDIGQIAEEKLFDSED